MHKISSLLREDPEEKTESEMAVHGWPTALCETLPGKGDVRGVCTSAHTHVHASVENGNGGYGPVVRDEANGQKGRSEETAYASAQP